MASTDRLPLVQTQGVNDLWEYHELHLDSAARDGGSNCTPSFTLPSPLHRVVGYRVLSVVVPYRYPLPDPLANHVTLGWTFRNPDGLLRGDNFNGYDVVGPFGSVVALGQAIADRFVEIFDRHYPDTYAVRADLVNDRLRFTATYDDGSPIPPEDTRFVSFTVNTQDLNRTPVPYEPWLDFRYEYPFRRLEEQTLGRILGMAPYTWLSSAPPDAPAGTVGLQLVFPYPALLWGPSALAVQSDLVHLASPHPVHPAYRLYAPEPLVVVPLPNPPPQFQPETVVVRPPLAAGFVSVGRRTLRSLRFALSYPSNLLPVDLANRAWQISIAFLVARDTTAPRRVDTLSGRMEKIFRWTGK
jgi:hypothetical protein